MTWFSRLLDFFYRYLYHDLAFTYDTVAAAVSFGQWVDWIQSTLQFIHGSSILELGYGPGHLQKLLSGEARPGLSVFGLDESTQMGRLAWHRLIRAGVTHPCLVRGIAQGLPFPTAFFDTVVSTFPSKYIFDPQTLLEVHRVLARAGSFVILPAAWPKSLPLKWLYLITGESPAEGVSGLMERISKPLNQAGFSCQMEIIDLQSSTLLVIIAARN